MATYNTGVSGVPRKKKQIKAPSRSVIGAQKPRRPGPPLFSKGPRPFLKATEQTDAPGDAPLSINITLPEWYIYWWLTQRKISFEFQSSLLGGRMQLGGLVADFILADYFPPGLIINPLGFYWHRYRITDRANDLDTKLRLIAYHGFTVVNILEDNVINSLDWSMRNALQGVQLHSDAL